MALIAVRTIVNVSADSPVVRIRLGLCVAARALEYRVVRRIRVARSAYPVGVAMGRRKPGVVEGRSCPSRSRMTRRAGRREPRSSVIGISRALVLGRMAGVAVGGSAREHVVDVTVGARDVHVGTRQRKRRVAVVECCSSPGRRAVTDRTVLREPRGHVVGIRRPIEIRLMARHARGRKTGVDVVLVAGGTGHVDVGARQRERRVVVVERRARPVRGRVADAAILREACRYVIRIGRAVEIRLMARHARG